MTSLEKPTVDSQPTFKPAQECFALAIEAGRLSENPAHPNFAGAFMYMGTWAERDQFKHKLTRQYLPQLPEKAPAPICAWCCGIAEPEDKCGDCGSFVCQECEPARATMPVCI